MFSSPLIRNKKTRLVLLLCAIFTALAIPTAVLVWQTYNQLKWESFHLYRGMAEELTNRINNAVSNSVDKAESRSFTDYAFLAVTGDPATNFVQKSPLSAFPVAADLPGTLGYFQVGNRGEFSTPLLPDRVTVPASVGLSSRELFQRAALAKQLNKILGENRLVEYRNQPLKNRQKAGEKSQESLGTDEKLFIDQLSEQMDMDGRYMASDSAISMSSMEPESTSSDSISTVTRLDSQIAFDRLNKQNPEKRKEEDSPTDDHKPPASPVSGLTNEEYSQKITDLNLDSSYLEKSTKIEKNSKPSSITQQQLPARTMRKEKTSELQIATPTPAKSAVSQDQMSDVRINTFESEIDPMEFSLLNSGHFVLFRKVWRNNARYVQGMLINQQPFVDEVITRHYRETALSVMSDLTIGYQGKVLTTLNKDDYGHQSYRSRKLNGNLLYRNRLPAPLDEIELIISISRLPPGPGAVVLGWITLVLALVFLGGFYALYRIGVRQIDLARKQQDFVSAVSHELKTPLTSIRMYGEMLKEGWATDDKKQIYYEFIHAESERLTRLISNILQFAKLSRESPQLKTESIVVGDLINRIKPKVQSLADHEGFYLKLNQGLDTALATINVDEDCFVQIIINLVDNAIKFSKNVANKQIEFTCRLDSEGLIVFSIRDHGPGIARDQMKKIFEMFYRSESELTRETMGTGIGLAIVYRLSLAMGGRVNVVNRRPGAEFQISFPSSNLQVRGQN